MKHRQRVRGAQGRKLACPWVRQELYEWFARLRYSIDWEAVRACHRGRNKHQTPGYFGANYCEQCLVRGVRPETFKPTSRWFEHWQAEYGLNMRRPNRKYKVPKAVMAERLELGWCNVARARALCVELSGYAYRERKRERKI